MGFSRADWITVAVTLILFGLAYYLSGPKAAFICLALGIVILVATMIFKREKQPPAPPSQSVQQKANPSITQNPTQTVNVNIDSQPRTQPTPAAPSTEPRPNIHFVGARVIDAYYVDDDDTFYETQDKVGDHRLAIACFRNDGIVGQRIQQPEVKAHIIYRDSEGQEITDVPRGAWMETAKDHVEFAIGKKSCLILFLLSNQGTLQKLWRESYFHEHSWMSGGPSYRLNYAAISGKIASIEILLLSEASGAAILQTIFDVEDYKEGELPKLTVRP